MWLCDNPDGTVLVYRVYPSGCDCPAACYSFPYDGHHGIRRGVSDCILHTISHFFDLKCDMSEYDLLIEGSFYSFKRSRNKLHIETCFNSVIPLLSRFVSST